MDALQVCTAVFLFMTMWSAMIFFLHHIHLSLFCKPNLHSYTQYFALHFQFHRCICIVSVEFALINSCFSQGQYTHFYHNPPWLYWPWMYVVIKFYTVEIPLVTLITQHFMKYNHNSYGKRFSGVFTAFCSWFSHVFFFYSSRSL